MEIDTSISVGKKQNKTNQIISIRRLSIVEMHFDSHLTKFVIYTLARFAAKLLIYMYIATIFTELRSSFICCLY